MIIFFRIHVRSEIYAGVFHNMSFDEFVVNNVDDVDKDDCVDNVDDVDNDAVRFRVCVAQN